MVRNTKTLVIIKAILHMVTTKEAQKSKKAQVLVDFDVVETSFEKWANLDIFQEH